MHTLAKKILFFSEQLWAVLSSTFTEGLQKEEAPFFAALYKFVVKVQLKMLRFVNFVR